MIINRRNFLCASAVLAGCSRNLAKPFNGYAFIACRSARLVSAVNLTYFKLSRQIPMEGEPVAVLVKPGSARVFVLLAATGTVVEIDANSMSIARNYKVGASAVSMRMASDGESIWVLARDPQALIRLDLKSARAAARIRLPKPASDFDLSTAAQLAAINDSPAIVNLSSNRIERPLEIDAPANIIRFRPDGKQVLAGARSTRLISIADVATGRLIVKLPIALDPERFCFSTDNGGQLFVTGQGMDAVAIVSPYQTTTGETILAGRSPGAMAADDNYVFVANPETGDMTVITIADRLVVAKVPIGQKPGFIMLIKDYALVLNQASGDLAVIRLSKLSDFRYKRAPLFTVIPVGADPVAGAIWSL